MQRILRLPARIALAVGAGAVLVALGVTLLLINTVRLHQSAEATTRSDAYLVAVISLERYVVDAETGLRGYVITGNPVFLQPTRAAQRGYAGARAGLAAGAAADGAFPGDARRLEAAADSYMHGYLPRTLALAAHDRSQSRTNAITLQGKRMVDAVRARTATLESLVSARERARQATAKTDAGHSTVEAIVVLVLLTVATLLLGVFLGYLVISRDRARRRSERTVDVLRRSLLPTSMPDIPGCDVAVRFLPAEATELVGGDFYDAFALGDGRWAVVVGDVCGKGAEAAAVTAMARWTLRSLATASVAPDEALRFLNRAMLGQALEGRFITLAYLMLSVEDGTRGARWPAPATRRPSWCPHQDSRRPSRPTERCWASGRTSACRRSSSRSSTATPSCSTPTASPIPDPVRSGCRPTRCAITREGPAPNSWPARWRPTRTSRRRLSATTSRSSRCSSSTRGAARGPEAGGRDRARSRCRPPRSSERRSDGRARRLGERWAWAAGTHSTHSKRRERPQCAHPARRRLVMRGRFVAGDPRTRSPCRSAARQPHGQPPGARPGTPFVARDALGAPSAPPCATYRWSHLQ